MTKKKPTKADPAEEAVKTQNRIMAFNKELSVLAEKYQVRLDVSMRIVAIDNKTSK